MNGIFSLKDNKDKGRMLKTCTVGGFYCGCDNNNNNNRSKFDNDKGNSFN